MATVRILLGFFWIVAVGSSWGTERNIIDHDFTYNNYRGFSYDNEGRKKLVSAAQNEVGVQEIGGNTGKPVDEYNAYVGFKKVSWCASFVSWCHRKAGYLQPRTAWTPALFPAARLAKNPMAGMVLGVYFPELKRIAHCGIVTHVKNELVYSVEGNTSLNGSREGTGVYRRVRHKRSIHRFADWITHNPWKQ